MTPRQQFVKDAEAGGFDLHAFVNIPSDVLCNQDDFTLVCGVLFEKFLLEPKAWEAVGKTREWCEWCDPYCRFQECPDCDMEGYLKNWNRFTYLRAKGRTIDESLELLLK
jgi:hypothetical protein